MTKIEQKIKPWYKSSPLWPIPQDWEIISLWKIWETYSWLSWKSKEDFWEGFPYVPYMNIFSNPVIKDDKFDFVKINEWENQHKIKNWDMFFTTSSETPEEVWMCSTYWWNNSNLYLNSFCFWIRLIEKERYSSIFLSNFFRSQYWRKIMYKLAQWATRYNLSKQWLLKQSFWVPIIEEQTAIAKILSTTDTTIQQTQEVIKKLELRNKGLGQKLLNNKKLKEQRFWDIFERVTKKNTENNTNVVTISAQRWFVKQTDFFNKEIASKILDNYFLVERWEFCYNKSYSNWYPMWATKRLNIFDKAVVTTLYICFKIKDADKISWDFFEHFFNANLLDEWLIKIANEWGRAHWLLNVTPNDFFNLKINIPAIEKQKEIATILDKATQQLNQYKQKLEKLQILKKWLMQQLLTGKVRVKVK